MIRADYPPLLNHILDGKHYRPLIEGPDVEHHRREWRALFNELIACPPKDPAIADRFHTQWHVSHHLIRELVADDGLLTDLMWVWLPRYQGPSMLLYRGENIDRFVAGRIGTAWTDKQETAEVFASGLNAVAQGGVILRVAAPAVAIVAGPSKHSIYLGESEFTIDVRRIGNIETVVRFPPSH